MGRLIKFPTNYKGGFQGEVKDATIPVNDPIQTRKAMEMQAMKCIQFLNGLSNQLNVHPNFYELIVIVSSPDSTQVFTTVSEADKTLLKDMINTAKGFIEAEPNG